jgi:hypothetical protein
MHAETLRRAFAQDVESHMGRIDSRDAPSLRGKIQSIAAKSARKIESAPGFAVLRRADYQSLRWSVARFPSGVSFVPVA